MYYKLQTGSAFLKVSLSVVQLYIFHIIIFMVIFLPQSKKHVDRIV